MDHRLDCETLIKPVEAVEEREEAVEEHEELGVDKKLVLEACTSYDTFAGVIVRVRGRETDTGSQHQ